MLTAPILRQGIERDCSRAESSVRISTFPCRQHRTNADEIGKKAEDPTTKAVGLGVVDDFSTLPRSRYRYAVPMQAINEKGSPLPKVARLEVLLNFCRTVVRSDDDLLRLAMGQYEQFLAGQQRG